MKLLVTGGAGFIGSAFIRITLETDETVEIVNLDKLTYAGNLENLEPVVANPRHCFVRGDICDAGLVDSLLAEQRPEAVVHFAAESHVDRSIFSPGPVFETNLRGTFTLLEAARKHGLRRFVHVSTDEVYGSIPSGAFRETDPISPSSPYSASKAGGDLQVLAWHRTFGLDAVITRGSNTFGPRQYPEKLIPLFVTNALDGERLPVYGDGMQVRDWIHVDDHCTGIWTAMERGEAGEVYNVGGGNEEPNMAITRRVLDLTGRDESLIRHVADRPGHDRRYALDTTRLRALGWEPARSFDEALASTVAWYAERRDWWEPIKSGEYRRYYEEQYGGR
jgi:dTDP-glucose 4,6-dehydratase